MSYAQCTTKTTFETRLWYEPYYPKNPNSPEEEWDGVLTIDPFEYPFSPREVVDGVKLPKEEQVDEFSHRAGKMIPQLRAEREDALKREMMKKGRALTTDEMQWLYMSRDEEQLPSPVDGEVYSVDVPDIMCHSYFFGLGPTECTKMGEERIAVYAKLSTTCTYVPGITPIPPPEELAALGIQQSLDPHSAFELEGLDLLLLQETLRGVALSEGAADILEYEDIMAYGEDPRHPLDLGAYRMTIRNEDGSFDVDDERIQIKMGLWRAIESSPISPEGKEIAKAMITGDSDIAHGPNGEGSYTGGVILANATDLLRLTDDEAFLDQTLGASAIRFFARSEPGREESNGRLEFFERL